MWFLVESTTDCAGVDVHNSIINIISTIVNLIKIAVPIILIILGMLDMGKAVASQKEDEIKKGQKTLMSRCIAAGIVFFVVAIVQLLFGIIGADDDNKTMWNCIDKFVNGVQSNNNGWSLNHPFLFAIAVFFL